VGTIEDANQEPINIKDILKGLGQKWCRPFYYQTFEYLLISIQNINNGFRTCDIVFNKGKSFFSGLPFLQFCKK
jgi:hypothetical protein